LPSVNAVAKTWQLELSARVGKAIQKRRRALNLTAQQLARRTAEIGYPVSRVAISKIEANVRAGKLDVAEWLILAQALEIPPALLLFPDYPEGLVEGLPGPEVESVNAVWWIAGRRARHEAPGIDLVGLVEQRAELTWELNWLGAKLTPMMMVSPDKDDGEMAALKRRIRSIEDQQAILDEGIRRAKGELWGEEVGSDD
jgi:transcriptional regulator with XRE-family HTH domain